MALLESFEAGELYIELHSYTSDFAQHPGIRIPAPQGFRIVGGGAVVNWHGAGNLLTGIFPESDRVWFARSKDHRIRSPATITAYCYCARMKDGSMISRDDYMIKPQISVPAQHPSTEVVLPDGWVLVGGGAAANYTGSGSLLHASHPGGPNSWIAAAKDHVSPEVTTVTAYAIGVKESFLNSVGVKVIQETSTSGTKTAHPTVSCSLPHGYRLIGGGAKTNWNGVGSLLTASYPQDRHTWIANGKDHEESDPSTITAWCVGVSFSS